MLGATELNAALNIFTYMLMLGLDLKKKTPEPVCGINEINEKDKVFYFFKNYLLGF